MKVVLTIKQDDEGQERHKLEMDGRFVLRVIPLCECPEDAIIGGDLVDGCQVMELMEDAYKAGLRQEHWEFETVNKSADC